MSARRFEDKPVLDPGSVWSLPVTHPAMTENRTLFPSTVVDVTATTPDRLLVSGVNNRKLGSHVEKGQFKGWALYGLSLEERATCPSDCAIRGICYGNGMQMARRHRIVNEEVFYGRIEREIMSILDEEDGLLLRLHVLGDFPSVEYVAFWKDMLDAFEDFAIYGYTRRRPSQPYGDAIGDAIRSLKTAHPERFRIRLSSANPGADTASVISYVPNKPKIGRDIVCPAQTQATACCATCGLCWETASRDRGILFIKHGPKSDVAAAETAMAAAEADAETQAEARVQVLNVDKITEDLRPFATLPTALTEAVEESKTRAIMPIQLPANLKPNKLTIDRPEVRMARVSEMRIEKSYQRDLSPQSISLIRKIITGWDWAKFSPPICAETPEGLFVIDGQHTAIAAASHPGLQAIPVLIVQADTVAKRAESFVSHNTARVKMSALQVFHAEVAAEVPDAMGTLRAALMAGAEIPRSISPKSRNKPGQIVSINQARNIFKADGAAFLERLLKIAVMGKTAPITSVVMRALRILLKEEYFKAIESAGDDAIASALERHPEFDKDAEREGAAGGLGKYYAGAVIIAGAVRSDFAEAAQ